MMTKIKYYPPEYEKDEFNCAHCKVFAHQIWVSSLKGEAVKTFGWPIDLSPSDMFAASQCQHCNKWSIWIEEVLVYPVQITVEDPNDDMPDDVKKLYEESAQILSASPRAAAALLRLGLQILLGAVGGDGKNINDDIGKETIDAMAENGVRLLAMRCAGFNNVSLKDIHNRFKVVRVPAYSPHAIAEYTVGLILAVNRKINKAYVRTREGNFSINGLMGVDLYGKTAGIIGTGKIGQILIKILKGFDMKVIAYDLFPNQKVAEELGFEYVSLDELYANSDIISLNCPLTKDTQYMINRRSMLKMKDGVILVNTGRGQLIDSADLVEALKDKKVGAVALDVYEEEEDYFFEDKSTQVIEDDILGRLLSFYNVLITSHQAYFTKEAVEAITVTTLNNIKDFIEGKPLVNEVPQS